MCRGAEMRTRNDRIFAHAKSQLAVRLVAAPTTQLGGVLLHCYSDVAVVVAVYIWDISVA